MLSKLPHEILDLGDSTVLVTGAGGTIGGGLVGVIKAKTIVAVDISEYAIYKIQRERLPNVHCVVGDISDKKIVDYLFKKYKIDYVFNAAAYKHVDTLEEDNNVYSVVKNNTLSVYNLCQYMNTLKGFVHISSDKAVNPTNNMGFTKLWCERIVQQYATKSTKIVRFGNVYKSSGSFIETLEWQLANNKPITITDPNMRRYFMSVGDAVSLIGQVLFLDDSNSTYILEMGEELAITQVVEQLNVNNAPIEYIGIRAGEKLSEELIYDYEQLLPTSNLHIHRVDWHSVDMTLLLDQLLVELDKDEICTNTLNDIITTTMIL